MSAATLEKAQEYASQLSAEEKSALMDFLLSDLVNNIPPEVDLAWQKEIDRRAKAMESGEDPGIPWEEVRDKVKKKYGFT